MQKLQYIFFFATFSVNILVFFSQISGVCIFADVFDRTPGIEHIQLIGNLWGIFYLIRILAAFITG